MDIKGIIIETGIVLLGVFIGNYVGRTAYDTLNKEKHDRQRKIVDGVFAAATKLEKENLERAQSEV